MTPEERLRDLISRLGFGNGITEPMADNDTVVRWAEEQADEAADWRESQRWRNDCYLAGHPDDEDCHEHDPALIRERLSERLAAAEALADEWQATYDRWAGVHDGARVAIFQAHANRLRKAIGQ